MEVVKKVHPPKGLSRLLARLPIHLYRLGLGWLFGRRLMLVNHVGRVTGQRRQVVLEVVEHDADDGSYVVASGWGSDAAWRSWGRRRTTCGECCVSPGSATWHRRPGRETSGASTT